MDTRVDLLVAMGQTLASQMAIVQADVQRMQERDLELRRQLDREHKHKHFHHPTASTLISLRPQKAPTDVLLAAAPVPSTRKSGKWDHWGQKRRQKWRRFECIRRWCRLRMRSKRSRLLRYGAESSARSLCGSFQMGISCKPLIAQVFISWNRDSTSG